MNKKISCMNCSVWIKLPAACSWQISVQEIKSEVIHKLSKKEKKKEKTFLLSTYKENGGI